MLTAEILEIGKWVGSIVAGCWIGKQWIDRHYEATTKKQQLHYDFLKAEAKEKSVGASAVVELMRAEKEVRDDMNEIKKEVKDQRKVVDKLESHWEQFIVKMWEYLNIKKT